MPANSDEATTVCFLHEQLMSRWGFVTIRGNMAGGYRRAAAGVMSCLLVGGAIGLPMHRRQPAAAVAASRASAATPAPTVASVPSVPSLPAPTIEGASVAADGAYFAVRSSRRELFQRPAPASRRPMPTSYERASRCGTLPSRSVRIPPPSPPSIPRLIRNSSSLARRSRLSITFAAWFTRLRPVIPWSRSLSTMGSTAIALRQPTG